MSLSIAEGVSLIKPLAFLILGMVIYAVLVFKFYRFVAKKDLFELNLQQYNKSEHPFINKFLGLIFYLVEYVLLFPLFTIFWFAVVTLLLTFLSSEPTLQSILLVAMALVATIRVSSYYNEELSKDLSKMLPFALLGVFLLDLDFVSYLGSFSILKELPSLWNLLLYYFIFIIFLEFILRLIHTLFFTYLIADEE